MQKKINTKNNTRKINKQLNLLINYTENHYKIKWLIKMNVNVHVIFSLKTWVKRKMNLFYKDEEKNYIKFFLVVII